MIYLYTITQIVNTDGAVFKWPTFPYLQQGTSPVSGSFSCTIALTDLDLQYFAKCPPCNIRNILFEVLCDLLPLIPYFYLFSFHAHLTLIEISFSNFVLPMQIVLQPEMIFGFSLMTFMHRKSWYSLQWKNPTSCASTTPLPTFTNAWFAKA